MTALSQHRQLTQCALLRCWRTAYGWHAGPLSPPCESSSAWRGPASAARRGEATLTGHRLCARAPVSGCDHREPVRMGQPIPTLPARAFQHVPCHAFALPLLVASSRYLSGFLLRRALVSAATARSVPGSRMGHRAPPGGAGPGSGAGPPERKISQFEEHVRKYVAFPTYVWYSLTMAPVEYLKALHKLLGPMATDEYQEVLHCLSSASASYRGKLDWSTRNRAEALVGLAIDLATARGKLR